jgi:uncharacterized protein (TIGR02466 family)
MLHTLFPTPVYTNNNTSFIDYGNSLFERCDNFVITNNAGFKSTLDNEYSPIRANVTFDILALNDVEPFVNFIHSSVNEFLNDNKTPNYVPTICNLWLNEMVAGQQHAPHQHYGYSLSGTYYTDVPAGSGEIMFYSFLNDIPHHGLNDVSEYTIWNSKTWRMPVEAGTIILFPAYLKHSVQSLEFSGIRRSIAFDIGLKHI